MSAYNWPHPGCVGLWHFEDNANDASGQGNNGTNSGGAAYGIGKFGKSTYLTVDYWILTYSAALKVSDCTISCWWKGTEAGSRAVLFATSGVYIGSPSVYYGYSMDLHDGKIGMYINETQISGSALVNDGNWHFLIATRDNSVARLFVDGRIDGYYDSPPAISYCNHYPAGYYWAGSFVGAAYVKKAAPSIPGMSPTGYIDELMVENYAISPQEALNRYLFQKGVLN